MKHQEVNTEPFKPFEMQQVSHDCIELFEGLTCISLPKQKWRVTAMLEPAGSI